MKDISEKWLIDKYPHFFRDVDKSAQTSCMYWGCSCDNGWFQLIADCCEELTKLKSYENIKFDQIKEKFGSLTIYYSTYVTDVTDENPNLDEEAEEIIDKYEILSFTTCEICGKPGKRASTGGWIKTMCSECVSKSERYNYYEDE